MQKKVKRTFILVVAILIILFGVIGLFLPFLQGILFLLIGLVLLSFYFPQVRPRINKHLKSFPHLFKIIDKIENWLKKTIGEI